MKGPISLFWGHWKDLINSLKFIFQVSQSWALMLTGLLGERSFYSACRLKD